MMQIAFEWQVHLQAQRTENYFAKNLSSYAYSIGCFLDEKQMDGLIGPGAFWRCCKWISIFLETVFIPQNAMDAQD